MKIKFTLIGIALIILLAVSNYFLFKEIRNQSIHIDELQQNQKVLLGDSLNKRLELNKKEFRMLLEPVLDSIAVLKGLKKRSITNITRIYNTFSDTTTNIYTSQQLSDSTYDISYSQKCWGFKGYFNIINKKSTITDKWFNDNIVKYTYVQRNKLFGKKWLPRWGKAHIYIGSTSQCGSKVKIQEFNYSRDGPK